VSHDRRKVMVPIILPNGLVNLLGLDRTNRNAKVLGYLFRCFPWFVLVLYVDNMGVWVGQTHLLNTMEKKGVGFVRFFRDIDWD